MLITDFDYHLPEELIAQEPLADRKSSRMLRVDRGAGNFADDAFSNFPKHLREGDVVVLNNTRVFPARLLGTTETGGNIEIFLVRPIGGSIWETLARPARRLKPGKKVIFGERLTAEVVGRTDEGRVVMKFFAAGDLEDIIDELGRTPLPPYIHRDRSGSDTDRSRYQTIFAKNRGAIAAPTAGLHFTEDILAAVRNSGAAIIEVTLHVGYGTFEPIRVENIAEHRVMSEQYEIGEHSADILNAARSAGRRIIAVGTTTTRALETSIAKHGRFVPEASYADLTILPGYEFKAVGGLLTNFHLPQSSLLVLVSTFAGRELIMKAYEHAVASRYRFYSYGDCMFIT